MPAFSIHSIALNKKHATTISTLEQEIDNVLYELYSLTPDEIAIVREKIAMQIKYSRHIETRLALRKIECDLPKRIYETAEERFTDTETGHTIAVMETVIYVG